MTDSGYRICTRCVMDTTDPDIRFDGQGLCNHCRRYDEVANAMPSGKEGKQRLEEMVERIKRDGANKRYDCIIGVSGGVDSTYVAYKVKELGLRPLAVHLDNGWDSELSVSNIELALRKLNLDLYTHVMDWEEFKDLQLAFLRASTPDSEIPSDHAIVSLLYHTADKFRVKYLILGCNYRTETHVPAAWSRGHLDWKYIKSVHRRFGRVQLKTFPHMDLWSYKRHTLTKETIDILNYLDYAKKEAMPILERDLGWRYYGGKHYESIYTRFYQGYILPKKFGYDKRRSHFSSLICSGEMTREEALALLKVEPYPPEMQEEDRAYVIKKLGLAEQEFKEIMHLPHKTYWDYPSYGELYKTLIYKVIRAIYRTFARAFVISTGIFRLLQGMAELS